MSGACACELSDPLADFAFTTEQIGDAVRLHPAGSLRVFR
jgi:hypothetical protein